MNHKMHHNYGNSLYRDVERNALLEELKQCLTNDSKEYFNKIKPKIVEVTAFLLNQKMVLLLF